MLDTTATVEVTNDARARGNVLRLAAAQALTGANSAVIFATGSIVGATLAPSISLATVPLSMYVLGLAAGTLPTGAISRRFGRRAAFVIGTGLGALTGLLGSFAILRGSFALFCVATFLGGLYGAVAQSYRFAATIALDWNPAFPHTGVVDPRSKVHKTGAVRAEKKSGKKRP